MVSEGVIGAWTIQTGLVKEGPRKGEKIEVVVPVAAGGGGGEKKEL